MKSIRIRLYTIFAIMFCMLMSTMLWGIMLMTAPTTVFAAEVEVEYGSGAEGDTYLISSANELYALSQTNSDWGKNFKLTQDIDLSTVCYEGKPWMPIGNDTNKFTGTFDGDNHKISGLYIDSTAGWQGLFGYVENGTIKNLKVKGTVSGNGYVGGIVGYFDVGTVEKCSFEGAVKGGSSSQSVGGIAGYNRGGTIKGCSNSGEVQCLNEYAGGIVGQNYGSNAKVIDCENTGTVSLIDSTGKSSTAGGIVGINVGGSKIINCRNTGRIGEVNNQIIGGIVGTNNSSSVTQCYNTGIVIGSNYIGGVAGQNKAKETTITQCYNTGAVSGSQYIGGVAGHNDDSAKIMSCYNTATVTGSSNVGGLAGQNCGGTSKRPTLGTVKNCYNRGTVTGNNSGGVVGLNKINTSEGTVESCYYLTGTAAGGVNNADTDGATVKTEAEFASGEVTWLLQRSQTTQVWGQWLKGNEPEIEKYPVLTDQLPKRVWKASFIKNGAIIYVTYVNNGGTVTPPTGDDWFDSNGARFNSTVQITEDKLLGLSVRFGAMTNNLITLDYGQSVEQNLDEWLEYEDGSPTEDKFTYTITDYDGLTGAYIEGSLLKIPSGTNVKEGGYTLQIKAHENNPRVDTTVKTAAFAVSDFGVDDVILTVTVIVNKVYQDPFSIDEIPNGVTYGDQNVRLSTTGGWSGGTVTWSVVSGNQYVEVGSNGELTILGAGEVVISATKSGGGNYYDAYDTVNLVIHKANQLDFTIDEIPSGVTYGDQNVQLSTTGGWSGGTVTWNVENGGSFVAHKGDGIFEIKGAGEVTISATKSGSDNYNDAFDTITFTIHKAVQSDFAIRVPSVITYGDSGIFLTTTGGWNGGTVAWRVDSGDEFAQIDSTSGELTIKRVGEVKISATIAGGDNYEDAVDSVTLVIHKAVQLGFAIQAPGGVTYGDGTFTLFTTLGSYADGAVTWKIESGNELVNDAGNGVFEILGAGEVVISATKSGGDNYFDAYDTVTIAIHKANQLDFTIDNVPNVTYGDGSITLTYSGGRQGGTVTWKIESGDEFVSHAGGGVFTIRGAGEVTISATVDGDNNYYGAYDTVTFTIHKALQSDFSITSIPNGVTFGDGTFTLTTAGGWADGTITWRIESGNEFVSQAGGGVFTIRGAGEVTISATKSGGQNYYDATDTVTLVIHKSVQEALQIKDIPTFQIVVNSEFTLSTAGGSSGEAVVWAIEGGAEIKQNGTVTVRSAGKIKITATMPGGANYYDISTTITLQVDQINQAALTIIVDAPDGLTYEENKTVTLRCEGGSGDGGLTWTVISGNAEFVGSQSGESTTLKINGAGEVTVSVTKAADSKYYAATTSTAFTVNKANQPALTISIDGAPNGITYGDENVVLTAVGGRSGGTVVWTVIEGNCVEVDRETGALTILHAGTATVSAYISADANYFEITALFTFTVARANQPALTIIVDAPDGLTYAENKTVTLRYEGGSGEGGLTWTVTSGNAEFVGSQSGVSTTLKINGAGEVTVSVTKAEDSKYYAATTSTAFTVNKANQPALTISIVGDATGIAYGDKDIVLETTGGRDGGTVVWTVIDGNCVEVDRVTGALTIVGIGNVTIQAFMAGDGNYYDTFATITFTVAKANQPPLTIVAPNGITYGEQDIVLSTVGGRTDGTVTWSSSDAICVEVNPDGLLIIHRTGEVTITASISGGDNYEDATATVTFIVKQANQGAFMIKGLSSSVTFGEGTLTLTAEGGSGNGDVQWEVVSGNEFVEHIGRGVFTIKGAGDVTITATKLGGDNYYDTSATVSFTVNKANQEAFRIIDLPNTVVFGDGTFTLNTDGGWEGGTVFWNVVSGIEFVSPTGEGVFKIIGAGEVIISATKTGGNNYYDISTSIRLLIEKATPDVTLPDALTAQYGDTLAQVALPQGWTWMDSTLSVGGIGVRGFSAVYTPSDTANYNTVTAVLTITVVKATPVYTLPTALTATYGDTLKDVALPAGWAWNDALTTKVGNAGTRTFSATFTPGDTENYEKVTVALTITVRKAIPQFTIPDDLKATVGDTLKDVALPAGWSWNDALTTKVGKAGQQTFTATFTPSDTENYETVTITLTITVEANGNSGFWWWWILLLIAMLILVLSVVLLILKYSNEKQRSRGNGK